MSQVLAVVTDVFFQVRIRAACNHAGAQVIFVLAEADLQNRTGFDVAFVDLQANLDVQGAIHLLKQWNQGPVIAFGPHVDAESRKQARAAGADRVLAKSRLVSELPSIVQSLRHRQPNAP